MKTNDLPAGVVAFGDPDFRGDCPQESAEQVTFFNWLRRNHPTPWGALAIHPRNEQQLRGGQHGALARHKAEGMTPGAADIIIPGAPAFVCELKRADRTKSRWQDGQREYLQAAAQAGAFACIAFGHQAAIEAFELWLTKQMTI